MKTTAVFLLVLCVKLSNCENVPDICALSQDSAPVMYCSCDSELFNKAKTITCFIFANFTSTDLVWKGFERQQKIDSLTLNSRHENPLRFVPVEVLKLMTELKSLTIGSGDLGNLNPYTFSRLNHLEIIELTSNNITGLSSHAFAYLPSLTKLTLSENRIAKLPENSFYELPELRRLYLDQNDIKLIEDLAFLHLPKLQEMDLFQNHIHKIASKTFVGLKSLHRLDLSRNRLSRLENEVFMSMPQLRELDLSANDIAEIFPDTFQGLSRLRSLKLNHNRIITLPGGVFVGAPDLMAIDLASNDINTLNEDVLDGLTHSKNPQFTFQMKKNPLVCGCELQWLANFALEHTTSTYITGARFQYIKCEVKDFVISNWTKGDLLQITALANIPDAKCPKIILTTRKPSTTSTSTIKPSPSPAVPEKQLSSEKENSEKMRPQEIEMSDAIVEDVTKSMVDSKAEKSLKRDSNGSVKAKFAFNIYSSVVYSFLIVILGSALRH